jgi:hypothetical protein
MLQLCYKTGEVVDFYIRLVYDGTVTYETYRSEISRDFAKCYSYVTKSQTVLKYFSSYGIIEP